MSEGMIIYSIVMGFTLIIMGGLTFLVYKRNDFTLISGFANRSKEEQQQLIQSGYTDAIKRYLLHTFIILFVTFIVSFLPIPYGMEIGFSVLLLYSLIGIVWIQRYEIESKRKRGYWITGSVAVVLIVGITGLTIWAFQPNQVTITDKQFTVSGLYGVEWSQSDIEEVQLLEEMPDVLIRTNGFAIQNLAKGHFRVDQYGSARLFLRGEH
ncbi:cellulose synthase/poly-beta-1,6-N-acetylglucosamine synthase-like glycosyltransferase [Alkalibacillus flavidus]|uniref:Cellulose synthase/poly-beta-1,6-N-acetylglucosamine synthase-like glycosyltransferase n=1 Tax=Alkalibacillus flavidus TaxID=546021 RepID=A0ABV2KTG4_9BACI